VSAQDRQTIATEIIERFTKNYGTTLDLALVIIEKNDGGYHMASTIPVEQASTVFANVASGTLLTTGLQYLQRVIARKMQ